MWWGRWDLNPGSPTPQAGILNHSRKRETMITNKMTEIPLQAIRRPQQPETTPQQLNKLSQNPKGIRTPRSEPANHAEEIQKTLALMTIRGKAKSTINNARRKLNHLSHVCNLSDPNDVTEAIGYSNLDSSSKNSYSHFYAWYAKANQITYQRQHFKYELPAPIMPTSSQVNRIISATTQKYATIFKLMTKTAVEPEELHRTHRNQFDPTQNVITIKGLKGHSSQAYPLIENVALMLKAYLAKYTEEYPFPSAKSMSEMWQRARTKAAANHNDPTLLKIPLKNLRNYSGAQHYLNMERPDPIDTMRHFRHKRMETTMHYLRNMVIDQDPHYDVKEATTPEQCKELGQKGYTKFDEIDGKHLYRKRQQTD